MSQELKLLLGVGAATIIILVGAVFALSGSSTTNNTNVKGDPKLLIHADSNKMGTDSAKVKIVEFGDFECPSCGQAYPIVKEITTAYDGKIQFVFRNFPLPIHPNAQIAAEAAEAAGAQGKYWQMHDYLYENQNDWSSVTNPIDKLTSYAKSLGLDTAKFKADIEASKYQAKITNDVADGTTLGVNATPTFYINGEQMVGVQSYDQMKAKIDAGLK